MNAAEIMTHFVVTVLPTASVREVATTLAEHAISGVPVCEADGTLVGVISEGDLIRPLGHGDERRREEWLDLFAHDTAAAPEFTGFVDGELKYASQLMRVEVITGTETTQVVDIVDSMTTHHIKRVPIVRDGKLIGIVTRADLVKTLVRHPEALHDRPV
jgi:CBS domain-containing protein